MTAKFAKLLILATVVAVSASCGDLVRQGHAPVTLVVKSLVDGEDQSTLRSDVITKGSIVDDMKVYVENGQAVHYGERLFAIKPA